jgi:hypothetical protein
MSFVLTCLMMAWQKVETRSIMWGEVNKSVLFSTEKLWFVLQVAQRSGFHTDDSLVLNPLNSELNTICHLLELLGAHHILHVSRVQVNLRYVISWIRQKQKKNNTESKLYLKHHTRRVQKKPELLLSRLYRSFYSILSTVPFMVVPSTGNTTFPTFLPLLEWFLERTFCDGAQLSYRIFLNLLFIPNVTYTCSVQRM